MALRILHNIYIKYYIIYIHTSVKIYKHVTICTYPISLVEKGVRMRVYLKKCIYVVVEGMVGLNYIIF